MQRLNKAFKLAESGRITLYDEQEKCLKFYVKKNKTEGYDVICQDGTWSCNCMDFYHRNNYVNSHLCKHILACIMWVALEKGEGQTELNLDVGGEAK
jgi:predicted nucleic acid-binding Zn finger protein